MVQSDDVVAATHCLHSSSTSTTFIHKKKMALTDSSSAPSDVLTGPGKHLSISCRIAASATSPLEVEACCDEFFSNTSERSYMVCEEFGKEDF